MAHLNFEISKNSTDKQIEDVIDARKKSGQYNIYANNLIFQNRRPISAPTNLISKESLHSLANDMSIINDDLYNFPLERIGPTDSEVTVVRVKQKGMQFRNDENKWNLNDDAVPGDGTHLGESPSLVNLVTLVDRSIHCGRENDECSEYLIPLSSWEPIDNPYTCINQSVAKFKISKSVGYEHRRSNIILKTDGPKNSLYNQDLNNNEDLKEKTNEIK
ncbi:hypothetical protein RN001_007056 [Aquatica leii]|uniref:Uncharacterized protein n=1 Tax=Aquatica leii TaxID=1421715 RepID=A0AAN7SQS3_9COLE|nr:hypothetical protein RN001_007056 [Aquatica leii]